MEELKIALNEESDEFEKIKEEWHKEAAEIRTSDELAKFADHLFNDYIHDYGTVVHAVAAIALAGAWLGSYKEGITGFQAGFVMWEFIRNWNHKGNKTGMKILDYDDMLYPQCQDRYEKVISQSTWERLQEEAKKNLCSIENAHPYVVEHWKSIVNGVVPFGYAVKED